MSNIKAKTRIARILTALIIVMMVWTAMPVNMWQVHAAEVSLSLNKEGEEPTYLRGEPIKVTATSDTPGDWVGLYHRGETPGSSTPSYYWYYVDGSEGAQSWTNGTEYNIYSTVNSNRGGYTQDWFLAAGEYDMILMASDYTVKLRVPLKIVEPTITETSLETENLVDVGESIRVNAVNYTDQAWVGIYEGEYTGQGSIDYYYLNGYNGEYYDFGVYEKGTYDVVLFQDGGYTEIKRETVTVGHIFGDWESNKEGTVNSTHSRVCQGHDDEVETEKCAWDGGTVTKPATETENGIKTYTCTKCYGTYEETIYAKKIVEENVTKDATCMEKGSKEVVFDDGTKDIKDIEPLGHDYGEWAYNEADKTHTKTCKREDCDSSVEKNTITEECSFDKGKRNGENVVFTCSECKGTSTIPLLTTNKTEYNYGEPINVTANFVENSTDWIGLYKKGETYDPNNGGVKSIYWCYPGAAGKTFDITALSDENGRADEYIGGEYKVVMFTNDSYTPIATVDIVVNRVKEREETTDATCTEPATKTIYYNDGTTEGPIETAPKLGHAYPEKWTFDAENKTHSKVCGNDASHVESGNCEFDEGVVTKEATETENGIKTFTCSICEGTFTQEISKKEVARTEEITPATCEGEGTSRTYYTDGTYIDTPIPKKGHAYPEKWTFNEETKTHSKVCGNDNSHVQSGECEFSKSLEGGVETYTCGICEGTYEHTILSTDKTSYCNGEPIMVTVGDGIGGKDWVGIYNKGETPSGGTGAPISYMYYYPEDSGKTFNIYDAPEKYQQKSLDKPGEYTIFILDDDGYNQLASVDITIGHQYGKWNFNDAGADSTHSRVCAVNDQHVDTDKCSWNEGETLADGSGTKYTCTVCGGSYIETHDYNYKYNEDQATHTKTCKDADCDFEPITDESCSFEEKAENGKIIYTCKYCKGSYTETLISTDKDTYDMYEPIMVTVDYAYEENDWVAIYKKGETPNAGNDPVSFYWYYPSEKAKTFDIYKGKNQENSVQPGIGERGSMTPGEYTIFLLANDGWTSIASVDVTITHEFGDWEPTADRTVKEKCEHVRVCDGTLKHEEKEKCDFDEGVETKAPTATEPGELTFTCKVCEGTYIETLPALGDKPVSTVVTEPTCTEAGYTTITYESGLIKKEEGPPALGHDYDEDTAVFDEETKTHKMTCKNDNKHVKSVKCSFETIAVEDGNVTHKCAVCDGTFESGILYVGEDTYAASDDIDVIATCDSKDSWVGLYGVEDVPGSGAGTVPSYYWYTVTGEGIDRNGKMITLTDFYNTDRGVAPEPGEYRIVLFGDGGYTNILAEKQITITESTTTFDVKVNGKAVDNGATNAFDSKDTVAINVTANGNPGNAWVGIYPGKYGEDFEFSAETPSTQWYWVSEYNGEDYAIGGDLMEDGVYTIVVYANGGYNSIKHMSYYTVTKEGVSEVIITEPTCTEPGMKLVTYEGEEEPVYVPIPALGHDIELVYDAETRTHSGVCQRGCGYSADKEDCTFDEGVEADYIKTYTCEKCGGQYTEELERPYNEETDRIYGDTRYETAMKTADQLKANQKIEKFQAVIVADGTNYADALSGTYLGKVKNAPILLVKSNSKDHNMKQIADYIKANLAEEGTVYILGGKNAVSDKFEAYFKDNKFKISRLGGADRYDTNLLILKEAGMTGNEILVCTGKNFADSLSASAAAKPILLVNNKELTGSQVKFLKGMKNMKFYIIGGTSAISTKMAAKVRAYGGTERISGATRYETSVKIAERLFDNPKSMVLAYGKNFPDGLAGGILAMEMNAPLILTIDEQTQFVTEYAKKNGIVSGVVLGGSGLISPAAAQSIFAAANQK